MLWGRIQSLKLCLLLLIPENALYPIEPPFLPDPVSCCIRQNQGRIYIFQIESYRVSSTEQAQWLDLMNVC